ncbi:hypothetical protein MNBD_PLANCTO03-675 [hydrothermal vent metagenome]|uniref:DUF2933 domain-containing protein n=1 Tax=hydrothermal vent metagenome TaxID=652676 RepID=A0A3B1DVR4_9ZZZZ
MKHGLLHLLGCIVPLLLVFLLPLFGVGSGITLLVFVVLMFGCHLLMMGRHGHAHGGSQGEEISGGHIHQHAADAGEARHD